MVSSAGSKSRYPLQPHRRSSSSTNRWPDERRALATRIINLSNTVGVVLIEHDLEIALTIAHRLTVFHLGKVIVDGAPDEVLSNPLVREIYLG
jgi:branched-chain amino acid transport system ATP-binding protein